jgi:hypothetical protein
MTAWALAMIAAVAFLGVVIPWWVDYSWRSAERRRRNRAGR